MDVFTKELVVKFYDNLRSQMSKAEALKEAQKALINQITMDDNLQEIFFSKLQS